MAPAAIIQIYNERDLRQQREAEVHEQALRLRDLIEAEQARLVEGIWQTLAVLRQTYAVRDGDVPLCQEFMGRVTADVPTYLQLYATDQNGIVRCGTQNLPIGTSIADRLHYRQAMETNGFAVGEYIESRTSGRPVLPFALPYQNTSGTRGGVVAALLDVGWLEAYLKAKPLPADAAVTVADHKGTVIVRVPPLPGLTGTPLPERYMRLVNAKERGTSEIVTLDNRLRIVAYSPLDVEPKGLFFSVGLDRALAIAPMDRASNRSMMLFLMGLAVILAAVAVGGNILLRGPVNALVDVTRRWRDGDLSARSGAPDGGSEIATLGRAFDAMADDLERQIRQREQAERDLRQSNALLDQVLEHLPIGVFVIAADGRIVRVNPAAERIWGGARRVALDGYGAYKGWWADSKMPLEPQDWAAARAITWGETSLNEVIDIECFDGTRKTIRNAAVPLRTHDNGIAGAVALTEDITERHTAEQALRDSQARYRAIVDTAVDAMVIIDERGTVQSFNQAAERIFGYAADEVIGNNVSLLMPDPHQGTHDRYIGNYMRTGQRKIIGIGREVEGRHRDGKPIPLELSIAEWWAGDQRFFTGIMRDISRRLEAERRLKENLTLLDTIIESCPDPIFVKDRDGRYVVANSATGMVHGKLRNHLIGVVEHDLLPPEIGRTLRENDRRIMEAGHAQTFEESVFSKGHNEVRHYVSTKTPLWNGAGDVVGVIGFARDITDRKQAEVALRASEERYRGLVETQSDLILRFGPDGRFTFVNDTTCRAFGRTRDELLDTHWTRVVEPGDVERVNAAIEHARTSPDHRATVEARMLTVNGVRWYAWEGYAIFDEAGGFVELQAVGRDVTERKAMEDALRQAKEEAEQANMAKSKFLAAASHDLRQPMQSLFLFSSALSAYVQHEKGQQTLVLLERGLDTLKALLDSLLDVSRLDAGVIKPEVVNTSLLPVVQDIANAYTPVAAGVGLTFRVHPSCNVLIRTDPLLLGRMIRNLVENAIRYTKQGGIEIGCHVFNDQARIEVRDTGIGVPPEHLDRIFEEFHQIGNNERDRSQGLGLGLAIVQRLSRLLGHPVEVESELRKGSTFSIEVPLGVTKPETMVAPCAPAAPSPRGRLALVIDDDARVLMALRTVLEGWGYEVVIAGSGDEALDRVRGMDRAPDVVLSDYRLRGGEVGTQVVLRIRDALGQPVPGVILTGETSPEHQREAACHGLGIAHKPVTPRQLQGALERQLRAVE